VARGVASYPPQKLRVDHGGGQVPADGKPYRWVQAAKHGNRGQLSRVTARPGASQRAPAGGWMLLWLETHLEAVFRAKAWGRGAGDSTRSATGFARDERGDPRHLRRATRQQPRGTARLRRRLARRTATSPLTMRTDLARQTSGTRELDAHPASRDSYPFRRRPAFDVARWNFWPKCSYATADNSTNPPRSHGKTGSSKSALFFRCVPIVCCG
jgi:hypothetical protein